MSVGLVQALESSVTIAEYGDIWRLKLRGKIGRQVEDCNFGGGGAGGEGQAALPRPVGLGGDARRRRAGWGSPSHP